MSRRTGRGRPRHLDHRGGPRPHDPARLGRPAAPAAPGEPASVDAGAIPDGVEPVPSVDGLGPGSQPTLVDETGPAATVREVLADQAVSVQGSSMGPDANGGSAPRDVPGLGEPLDRRVAQAQPANGNGSHGPSERSGGCTTAQLRRFIKSRAYVPIHEIRRRFLIATEDDDVSGIELGSGRVYVGLPEREGQMLGELLRGGEVGYELQLDPLAPVVIGVYPMRPVSRG